MAYAIIRNKLPTESAQSMSANLVATLGPCASYYEHVLRLPHDVVDRRRT